MGVTAVLAVCLSNTKWARHKCSFGLETVGFLEAHTGRPAAAHTESLEITFPWENTVELLQMAREKAAGWEPGYQTDAAGDEGA